MQLGHITLLRQLHASDGKRNSFALFPPKAAQFQVSDTADYLSQVNTGILLKC